MQNDEREREPGDASESPEALEAPEVPEAHPPAIEGPAPDEQSAAPPDEPSEEQVEEFETVPSAGHPAADLPTPAVAEPAEVPEWPAAEPIPAPAVESDAARRGPDEGPPPSEAEAYAAVPPVQPAETTAAHSVPATPVGESTQCPRCGTENRPGVAFCRNCGQRLLAAGVATAVQRPSVAEGTQQCPRCGTHNRAGVAFCQNCGANLRAAAAPAPGYVPPTAPAEGATGTAPAMREQVRGGAVLGPIVLLVGAVGLAAAWLLPFPYGDGSLWDRSFGAPNGYGIAFWNGYTGVTGGAAGKGYFALAAPAVVLAALLAVLAIAGFLRAAPGALQRIGLVIAILWAVGLAVLFVVVEVAGGWSGDLVSLLRNMSPAGIIFLLSSLIVLIGAFTRLARS